MSSGGLLAVTGAKKFAVRVRRKSLATRERGFMVQENNKLRHLCIVVFASSKRKRQRPCRGRGRRRKEKPEEEKLTQHMNLPSCLLDRYALHLIILLTRFTLSFQISNMPRHDIMESMFANPIMLDDLDFLYKSDNARKVLFFHQVTLRLC